ncbi:hypothetical protein HHI36_008120 [Cryptolaemus montrouzieri]|uniref:Uncharacterized protein n=1 Tax=Cryptolaemus montrouzieri TaxID=559131 RepID=A0ABD2MS37_9CUCU
MLRSLNIEYEPQNDIHEGPNEILLWTLMNLNFRLDLSRMHDQATSPELYLKNFNRIQNEYATSQFIFNDGSKIVEGVGCAISIENNTYQSSMSKMASIYFAEQMQYGNVKDILYVELRKKYERKTEAATYPYQYLDNSRIQASWLMTD